MHADRGDKPRHIHCLQDVVEVFNWVAKYCNPSRQPHLGIGGLAERHLNHFRYFSQLPHHPTQMEVAVQSLQDFVSGILPGYL
ncbi:hypothetical protein PoB_005084100 [Plakobranchus ocellatus]|uniref:Uncharacterized protein n=1 Tax=Plakobranchus ocellatus TaxID=259542 RepID=A0AAV4BV01_9GAST|nr:hypothetical protein PoB_005084100 [Plakobranchus ocellatus]